MQIKRDYSQPFFGARRRRTHGRLLLTLGLLIGGLLALVAWQFDQLQVAALEMVGLAPTATALPSEMAGQAMDFYRAGNTREAARLWEQVVRKRPDTVDYLYEYGQVLIDLDTPDPERALAMAERIIDIAPDDVRGYALKARALVWSGDSASAISTGAIGLSLDPNFAPMHAALARAYTDVARFQDALAHGEKAVELDPLYPDAHRSYAYVLASVRLNDQAIDQLEQAIALNPNQVAPYFELAFQYLSLDRNEEAIATYDRILSLQPRNAKAMLRQCLAFSKVGQFDRAIGYCRDATTNDPTYTAAFQQLGIILYNRLDFSGALDAFQQCVINDPTNLECQYRRGLTLYYLKECDEAWTTLQESLLMAQNRADQQEAINNIRAGLTAITNDCPAYRGLGGESATPENPGGA